MSKLFIMVGVSGSGKSSIAKQIAEQENAVVVSSDAIREELSFYEDQSKNNEVFELFRCRIRNNLHNGVNVVADATNLTFKSRRCTIEVGKCEKANIFAYVVDKEICDCYKDNKNREHPVPETVLYRQIKSFQMPIYEEGFDEIIVHKCIENEKEEEDSELEF